MLDGRQYRSPQPCGETTVMSDIGPPCPEASDPARSMIGAEQERWLLDELEQVEGRVERPRPADRVRQVRRAGRAGRAATTSTSGTATSRRGSASSTSSGERKPSNPVVITGDIHAAGAGDLKLDFTDPASPSVGTEFIGTSISSTFPESFIPIVEAAVREAPYAKYFEARRRGYVRCTLDASSGAPTTATSRPPWSRRRRSRPPPRSW